MAEQYFVNGSIVTKEEYLADGGMPVPREPFVSHQWGRWPGLPVYICERCKLNTTEVSMDSWCPGPPRAKIPEEISEEALEAFAAGPPDTPVSKAVMNIRAEDVEGVAHYYVNEQEVGRKDFMAAALSTGIWEEIQRVEKKNFGNVQNYMHNTLGLTRAHIEKLISEKVKEYSLNIVREYLLNAQTQPGTSNWFTLLVQKTVIDEIQKSLGGNKLQTFVQDTLLREIQKHVLSRMKVDIRVTSVNPEDGILREIVTPSVIREAREI